MKIPTRLHKIYEHMMYRINYQTLKTRIRKGWNIEKALKEKAA